MDQSANSPTGRRALTLRQQLLIIGALAAFAISAVTVLGIDSLYGQNSSGGSPQNSRTSQFVPEREQLAALHIETIPLHSFHNEITTDAYFAANGGFASQSASAAQIAKSGSPVPIGQSGDLLQAQSDLATAHAQYLLATAGEKRQHALYQVDGAALKDWQQSQADLASAAVSLSTARSKLRLLGRSDRDITAFEAGLTASGPSGRAMLGAGGKSALWLVANVREADASLVHAGDRIEVHVPALPGKIFDGSVSYIASVIDPSTHRLAVAGVITNAGGFLRPNMLASVTIDGGNAKSAPAVPRNAVVFSDDGARVWHETSAGGLALRSVTLGRTQDGLVEVTNGLKGGERIVTGGALFLDQTRGG